MATAMEAAMFIMINMYGYVCAYVFVHAYVYKCATDTTNPHPHPPPTCQGDPLKQYKFNTSWTNRDKSILFADLKSA